MTHPTISAGTIFSVSASMPGSIDLAGFSALNYTPIRGARNVGDIVDQAQTITRNPLGKRFSYQHRVGHSSGSVNLQLVRLNDAGQALLRNAMAAKTSYSYCLKRPDESLLYFTAQATRRAHGGFDPSSIADTAVTLEIDSEIIEVD